MTFEMGLLLLGIIQIFGFFVEGSAGFGCTVISSPFATSILGVTTAVPFGTNHVYVTGTDLNIKISEKYFMEGFGENTYCVSAGSSGRPVSVLCD